ncbi:MAG: hypothetical protein N3A00_03250 [Thermodesulfovibrio sp.]|nr:hypothetical protein [Thermodesulfovibrio sp.]
MNFKEIFSNHLTSGFMNKLWTSKYFPVLPITPQDFYIGSLLNPILYMFRWGQRRGKGYFREKFGKPQLDEKGRTIYGLPTIEDVAERLSEREEWFYGFSSYTGKAILGDLLLTFCLENKNHYLGRNEQIQRAYPTHYMSSWIDLPYKIANLRHVPEMITAILVNQNKGERIEAKSDIRTHFKVASGFEDNALLRLFGRQMTINGQITDLSSDTFIEEDEIGIDELMIIRIAQICGQAPHHAHGTDDGSRYIPNQKPIASKAVDYFREDFNIFIRVYGDITPRQTLLKMLECCLSINLTNIYLSTVRMLFEWEKKGSLPSRQDQKPVTFFVDCSSGNDKKLRTYSEESVADFLRIFERFPIVMMCLRILDEKVSNSKYFRNELPEKSPDATEFINLLGSVLRENHPQSNRIIDSIDELCAAIEREISENQESLDNESISIVKILKGDENPIIKLAEAICRIMPRDIQMNQYLKAFSSCLMLGESHGLLMKRKTSKTLEGKTRRTDAQSIVLSNTMLDFLVHRHLRKEAQGNARKILSLSEFIRILKDRYGLYIDESPPAMSISSDYLKLNRQILERRLRDLGLLISVNDAESMKLLRERFKSKEETND